MDTENLKTFCVVAQYKSFRKAADIMQVTQPAISRRIKSLEDELGHPLLIRTPKYVALTKQGTEFLPYAERTIQILEEGTNKIIEGVKEEQLIVGGAATTCFNLLPKVFKEFNKEHQTRVSIYSTTSQKVVDMLIDQTIDIGFSTTTFPISLLQYETVYKEEYICVGKPSLVEQYIEDKKIIKSPVPIILNNISGIKGHPLEPINHYFLNSPLYEPIAEANYNQISQILAREGIGLATIPFSDAMAGLESGELIKVSLPNIHLPKRPVNMVTYKNNQMKNSVLQFRETVKRVLSNIDV